MRRQPDDWWGGGLMDDPVASGDTSRSAVPNSAWRGGRMRAPHRLLVLLACDPTEAGRLQQAWVGQSIDVECTPDLATALVRTGQLGPAMVVVGDPGGVLGPVEFLQALRQVDTSTPVIVGIGGDPQIASDALAAGATAVVGDRSRRRRCCGCWIPASPTGGRSGSGRCRLIWVGYALMGLPPGFGWTGQRASFPRWNSCS